MNYEKAQIVRSLRGHDSGQLFCILEVQDGYLLLADGKHRKVSNPKRKNVRHVEYAGELDYPTMEKVRDGQPVQNKEMRRALAVFREKRRYDAWQRMM